MSNVAELDTKKNQVYQLLKETTPEPVPEPDPEPVEPKNSLPLFTLLGISLIGTMLPFHAAVTFFSFVSILTFIVYSVLAWKGQARSSKTTALMLVALTLTSVLSGCGPALFADHTPGFIDLIREREYHHHTKKGIGVFGLGLDDMTIPNTQFDGNIEEVHVAETIQGYGIISLARITVAGK